MNLHRIKSGYGMRRACAYALAMSLLLTLLLPCTAFTEGERIVLTIGDTTYREAPRMSGDDQLGIWKYLEDRLNVEFRFVYLSPEDYDAALTSGNLPDIVSTQNNLAEIRENGLALDAQPYLEEYVPNLLKGEARLTYDVFRQLVLTGTDFISSLTGSATTVSDTATHRITAAMSSAGTTIRNWAIRQSTARKTT